MCGASMNKFDNVGFVWWNVYGLLVLIGGSIGVYVLYDGAAFFIFGLLNIFLGLLVLGYNKYIFLLLTVVSFNPIIWIVNGFYLKKRWGHPKVNGGKLSKGENSINSEPLGVSPEQSFQDSKGPAIPSVIRPDLTNEIYSKVVLELESGNVDKGLWARLFSEVDGDENRTKARYLKARAEQIIQAK